VVYYFDVFGSGKVHVGVVHFDVWFADVHVFIVRFTFEHDGLGGPIFELDVEWFWVVFDFSR